MMSSYQFRLGLEEDNLKSIFNEPEIHNRLEEILADSTSFILDFIVTILKLLFYLADSEEEREIITHELADRDTIIDDFKNSLMSHILYLSLYKCLKEYESDIKNNILSILNQDTDYIKSLLKERLVRSISSLTYYKYDDLLTEVFF